MPVLAWPMMSWPDSATGRVIAWMGNGCVMPASASAWTISGRTSKSANEASTACTEDQVFFRGRVMGSARAETCSGVSSVVVTRTLHCEGW